MISSFLTLSLSSLIKAYVLSVIAFKSPILKLLFVVPVNFIEFKIPNRLNETIYSKFKDWPVILFIAFLLIILYIFRDKNLKESSKNE